MPRFKFTHWVLLFGTNVSSGWHIHFILIPLGIICVVVATALAIVYHVKRRQRRLQKSKYLGEVRPFLFRASSRA